MINSFTKTSQALIKEWPEIFENIEINTIPVMYLDKVTIEFITGRVWEVDVKNHLDTMEVDTINDLLRELFAEYKDEIKHYKYTFDVELLKAVLINLGLTVLKTEKITGYRNHILIAQK